jgi:hypothetical protein
MKFPVFSQGESGANLTSSSGDRRVGAGWVTSSSTQRWRPVRRRPITGPDLPHTGSVADVAV